MEWILYAKGKYDTIDGGCEMDGFAKTIYNIKYI